MATLNNKFKIDVLFHKCTESVDQEIYLPINTSRTNKNQSKILFKIYFDSYLRQPIRVWS